MRYHKGSIHLSDTHDIPLLRKCFQAGHATARQLYRALNGFDDRNRWNVFLRRVRDLATRGFVSRLSVPGIGDPVYTLGEEGARALQGRLTTYVEAGPSQASGVNRNHAWHDVELFDLHLKILESGLVRFWVYESEIRLNNELTSFGYSKDYDAVVGFQLNGHAAKVAIEYERTLKSTQQYRRIGELFSRETKIDLFLYLVSTDQIESFLLTALAGSRSPVYIARAQKFAESPATSALLSVATRTEQTLSSCLLDGSKTRH